MPLPEGAGVYSTAAGDPRDRIIYSQQKIIESLTDQLGKLTEQIVRLSNPQPIPMFGPIPAPLSEEEEDRMAMKAFEDADDAPRLDFDDPEVREILEAAGALSSDITVAE